MSQGEVFTRYRALFSSSSIPPYENEEVKKINDLEFVDFLFELIRATKGQKNYKNVILKGVFSELKRKSDINIQIKKILKQFFACEFSILIPDIYTVNSITGINIDISEIDPYGLLKVDPNSSLGKHLYEGNDITKHLNYIFFQSLKATQDKPLHYSYKGRELFEIYSSNVSTLIFKFGNYYTNRPLSDWVIDYLDSTDFFNLPNFTAILMDLLTGAISIKAGKGKLEIKEDSKLIKALKKIFSFCSENKSGNETDSSLTSYLADNEINSSENNDGQNSNNDIFEFTSKELDDIERDSDIRTKGAIRFSTCNELEIEINPDDVLLGLDGLFGAYKEVPDKNVDDLIPEIYDNLEPIFNIDKTNNFFDDMLKNGTKKVIDSGETDLYISFPNMQAELQLGIFKAIPYSLIKSVLGPKLLVLPKITSTVIEFNSKNTVVKKVETKEIITRLVPILRNIGLQIVDKMLKNIFDEIKKDILKLTKELAVRYIKQRGADYILTLTSLLRLFKKIKNSDKSRCKSTISKLLSLLNLANFGPMPSIPGPLILIGGARKPGLNKVSMVNDLKAKLQSKGIETAPSFPDGTPNYLMYALEEMMGVVVEHIKTNSKIDVFAMGPTGPITGKGQMQ